MCKLSYITKNKKYTSKITKLIIIISVKIILQYQLICTRHGALDKFRY